MDAIVAENIVKIYDGGVKALNGVSLKVGQGRIYTLLGRNGAGKTTLLRILATQLLPTSGSGEVMGHDIISEAEKVREHIAVIPQESRPMYLLTVREHVRYFLWMRGTPLSEADRRAYRIIRELGLEEYEDRICLKLSGGLRRKVLVAMAMATEADIIFLDEPTTGLDPLSRRLVWEVVEKAVESGQTIFMTTHYMEEAEKLSHEFALIHDGRVVVSGRVEDVKRRFSYSLKVEVPIEYAQELEGLSGRVVRVGRHAVIYIEDKAKSRMIHDELVSRGIPVSFSPITLEDVFVEVMTRNDG